MTFLTNYKINAVKFQLDDAETKEHFDILKLRNILNMRDEAKHIILTKKDNLILTDEEKQQKIKTQFIFLNRLNKAYDENIKGIKVKYSLKNNLHYGRAYADISLNCLCRRLRETLLNDFYKDIDIKKAHYTFIYEIRKINNDTDKAIYINEFIQNDKKIIYDYITYFKLNETYDDETAKALIKQLLTSFIYHNEENDKNIITRFINKYSLNKDIKITDDLYIFLFNLLNDVITFKAEIVKHNTNIYNYVKQQYENNLNELDEIDQELFLKSININSKTLYFYLSTIERYIINESYIYCKDKGYIKDTFIYSYDGMEIYETEFNDTILTELNEHIKNKCNMNIIFTFKDKTEYITDKDIYLNRRLNIDCNYIQHAKQIREIYGDNIIYNNGCFYIYNGIYYKEDTQNNSATYQYISSNYIELLKNECKAILTKKNKEFLNLFQLYDIAQDLKDKKQSEFKKYLIETKQNLINDITYINIYKQNKKNEYNDTLNYILERKENEKTKDIITNFFKFLEEYDTFIIKNYKINLKRIDEISNNLTNFIKQHLINIYDDVINIDWDNKAELITFENIIYNLEKQKVIKPQRHYLQNKSTGYDYIFYNDNELNEMKQYLFNEVIKKIIVDEEARENYLIFMATGLYGEQLKKVLILTGEGDNGKTILRVLLSYTLGSKYFKKIDNNILFKKKGQAGNAKPDLINMIKARLVCFTEPTGTEYIDTNLIKDITGDTDLTARQLYSTQATYYNALNNSTYIECNLTPYFDEGGKAIYNRLNIIKCKSIFLDKDIYEEKTDEEITNNLYFLKNNYFTTPTFYNKYKLVYFHILKDYLKIWLDNSKQIKEYKESLILKREHLYNGDPFKCWFFNTYRYDNNKDIKQVKNLINSKDLLLKYQHSNIYNSLTKAQQRELTPNKFKILLESISELKDNLKKRDEYINGKQLKSTLSLINYYEYNEEEEEDGILLIDGKEHKSDQVELREQETRKVKPIYNNSNIHTFDFNN